MLAALIANRAGSLAGRLAGSLAFAAAALDSRFLQVGTVECLDVLCCLHSKSPFPDSGTVPLRYNPIIPHLSANFNSLFLGLCVSPVGSVGASAFGRGVHRTPAPPTPSRDAVPAPCKPLKRLDRNFCVVCEAEYSKKPAF